MRIDFARYNNIVILTGAGVSAGSGLRTYRGPGGVWDEYNVEEYGHIRSFRERPQKTWQLFGSRRETLRAAKPNAAHYALARLEERLQPSQRFLLVTQNVDGLHHQAGSRNVVELHGNLRLTRCSNDACDLPPFADEEAHADDLPVCPRCGSILRPDIVLFGEPIALDAGWKVKMALRDCDLFLAIGTSGVVAPAAHFVYSAESAGARTVYVNLEPLDPPNPAFQEIYLGKAEELLPELLAAGAPG